MSEIKSYQDLEVWKQSKDLVTAVYRLTKNYPKEESYGLVNQMRRAAVSIPSNIAEGCGRNHTKDSIQFFFISRGSLYEVETQIVISNELAYVDKQTTDEILIRIQTCKKLLNGFINYFQSKPDKQLTTINEQLIEYGDIN